MKIFSILLWTAALIAAVPAAAQTPPLSDAELNDVESACNSKYSEKEFLGISVRQDIPRKRALSKYELEYSDAEGTHGWDVEHLTRFIRENEGHMRSNTAAGRASPYIEWGICLMKRRIAQLSGQASGFGEREVAATMPNWASDPVRARADIEQHCAEKLEDLIRLNMQALGIGYEQAANRSRNYRNMVISNILRANRSEVAEWVSEYSELVAKDNPSEPVNVLGECWGARRLAQLNGTAMPSQQAATATQGKKPEPGRAVASAQNLSQCISLVQNAHYGAWAMTNSCAEDVEVAFCYFASASTSFVCDPARREGWQRGSHTVRPGRRAILPDSRSGEQVLWHACSKGGIPKITGFDPREKKVSGGCL